MAIIAEPSSDPLLNNYSLVSNFSGPSVAGGWLLATAGFILH
jgi:hypothetical protein